MHEKTMHEELKKQNDFRKLIETETIFIMTSDL